MASASTEEIIFPEIPKEYEIYRDKDVRILRPDCKYGIVIPTFVNNPAVCDGLKTVARLLSEGIDVGRKPHLDNNELIFFRAPPSPILAGNLKDMYVDFPRRLESSYVSIRIDPKYTNVFNSESRTINKIPMAYPFDTYYKAISFPRPKVGEVRNYSKLGLTFYDKPYASTTTYDSMSPYPHRFSCEVIVRKEIIPPEWFVECHITPKLSAMHGGHRSNNYFQNLYMMLKKIL